MEIDRERDRAKGRQERERKRKREGGKREKQGGCLSVSVPLFCLFVCLHLWLGVGVCFCQKGLPVPTRTENYKNFSDRGRTLK